MIPDFNDFYIAIGFTIGYGTPVSVEELITNIIENFDIEYDTEQCRPTRNGHESMNVSSGTCLK